MALEPDGAERIAYQGKMIEVVEQPMRDGQKSVTFERARRSPGTRIIIPREDRILLSREFRTELGTYDVRLPGGKVFDKLEEFNAFLESGADMQAAAEHAIRKEALEEVGVQVDSLALFGVSKLGATVEWDLYYFVATAFSEVDRVDSGEGEDIERVLFPIEECKTMCLNGQISEERSALMLLRYLNR